MFFTKKKKKKKKKKTCQALYQKVNLMQTFAQNKIFYILFIKHETMTVS